MAMEKLYFLSRLARITRFAYNPIKNQLRQSSTLLKSVSHCQTYRWEACRSLATGTQGPTKVKQHSRTAYIIFANDKMAALQHANPGIKVPDIGRMLGQMWRLLSEEEKEAYKLRYMEEKELFAEEKKAQMENLSEEEVLKMEENKKLKRRRRHARRIRKLKNELGKPKPVDINPYILFVKAKCLERGDAPMKQYIQGVSAYWTKMAEDDKQPYIDEARENSTRYRKELAEWERKMIAEGHENLISKSHLRKKKLITKPRVVSKLATSKTKPTNKRRVKKPAQKKADQIEFEESTAEETSHKKPTSTGPGKKSKKVQTEE